MRTLFRSTLAALVAAVLASCQSPSESGDEAAAPSSPAAFTPPVLNGASKAPAVALEGLECTFRVTPWRVGPRTFFSCEYVLTNRSDQDIQLASTRPSRLSVTIPGGAVFETVTGGVNGAALLRANTSVTGQLVDLMEYFYLETPGTYHARATWQDTQGRQASSAGSPFTLP